MDSSCRAGSVYPTADYDFYQYFQDSQNDSRNWGNKELVDVKRKQGCEQTDLFEKLHNQLGDVKEVKKKEVN